MDIVVVVAMLIGAGLVGFMLRGFSEKYRLNVMLSLSQRAFEDAPCWERLEKAVGAWKDLKPIVATWRKGLSPEQHFALVILIQKMDDCLDFDLEEKVDDAAANDRLLS